MFIYSSVHCTIQYDLNKSLSIRMKGQRVSDLSAPYCILYVYSIELKVNIKPNENVIIVLKDIIIRY